MSTLSTVISILQRRRRITGVYPQKRNTLIISILPTTVVLPVSLLYEVRLHKASSHKAREQNRFDVTEHIEKP